MKMKIKWAAVSVLLGALCFAHHASAERMPQDNWYYVKTIGTNGPTSDQIYNATGLAISRSNQIYVVDSGNNRIQVFDPEGNFLFRWGSAGAGNGQFNYPRGICIDSNELIYVCDQSNNRIQVFDINGGYLTAWAVGQPTGIAYSRKEHLIYVADNATKSVRVFSADVSGAEVRSWGVAGNLPGQFGQIKGIAIGIGLETLVYVNNDTTLQLFTPTGEFIRHKTLSFESYGIDNQGPWIAADGTVVISESSWFEGGMPRYLALFSQDITEVDRYGRPAYQALPALFTRFNAFAEGADGMCFFAPMNYLDVQGRGVECYRKAYRTVQVGALPRPLLLGVKQRPGTTYVDVDYRIVDGDSTNVEVAAVALVDGTMSLNQVILMNSFGQGTATNLGANMTANRDYHLAWNAAADWTTNFGSVKVCILANDGRELLDHLLLHIPANGTNAALTISRDPVTDADLLTCWLWLVAKGDPAITLAAGQVKSNATVFASGTTTTASGRAFLFARMGLREASAAELQYVREAGTPGVVNQWSPRFQVGPIRWPQAVNAWGFDSGNWGSDASWVVKP